MNWRIALFKNIDRIAGPILIELSWLWGKHRVEVDSASPERILFIRPGGIGDAVLLIPAVRETRNRFPDAQIHVLAEKRNAEVFSLCPDIDRVFHYDRIGDLLSVIRGKYDAVIDTEQWHRLSAVVARLVLPPVSSGFATNERKKLFSHAVPYSHDDHEVDSFYHLVEPLIGKAVFDTERPFLSAPEGERDIARHLLEPLGTRTFVALFPGGSIPERQWGAERFHAVAERLAGQGYGVVVIGGTADHASGEMIVRGVPSGLNLCGKLTMAGSAAVLEGAALLITGDSGIMHLGYAVGTKVLALFGPGIEKKWAPRSSRVTILNKHLTCSPCTKFGYTPKCKIDAACMKGIAADAVIENAMAMLGRS